MAEEKKCFICGATKNLVRTECCGKWICDDEDKYVPFSYARNSCHRNHRRFTLCAYHHDNGHKGDWKTCKECREMAEPEMVAWYGTNEYNWEKMPNPPKFKPTKCFKCGKIINLPQGGYSHGKEGYQCSDCFSIEAPSMIQQPEIPKVIEDAVVGGCMVIKLKLELKYTKIKRVITLPRSLTLLDLNRVIQRMFGFENDHLWNFRDRDGNEYNTCCDPLGGPLNMHTDDMLEPDDFTVDEVLPNRGDVLLYSYDYGDGWEIIVTRMADPKSSEVACFETCGTNAIEDIGGVGGLEEFTKALKKCKLKGEEEDSEDNSGWPIAEWGYDDPEVREEFLAGPTMDKLTQILRDEVTLSEERRKAVIEAEQREQMFKKTGRNEPCPCGSGKKFKKCCGANR